MKPKIHQTPDDHLASTSEATVSAVKEVSAKVVENTKALKDLNLSSKDKGVEAAGFTAVVASVHNASTRSTKETSKKLEEVKSAALITNKLLKEISKKEPPTPEKFPTSMDVSIKGVSVVTLKGDKGEKGEKGDTIVGPAGKDGKSITGPRGPAGKDGKDGKTIVGPQGPRGNDGIGLPGRDGSPDTPDEVVDKVNAAETKIEPDRISGLPQVMKFVDNYGTNPMGKEAGGGFSYRWLSNGVVVSAHVTEINFSTNITPTYDGNGRITLTATGGGGTTYSETPTGTINGSNVTFTTVHTITTVINFAINGMFIHPAEYSAVGTTITFVTAPPADLSGKSFTIIYQ